MKSTSKLISLSEEQLMDCSTYGGSCSGSNMIDAFKYTKYKGIYKQESYPYVGSVS